MFLSTLRSCSSCFVRAYKKQQQQTKIHCNSKNEYEGFWNYWLYLYSCVHLQYIQVCMCKRVIHACCYKEHLRDICGSVFCIRQYLSKKKKKKEKKEEKRMKNGICVLFKSHTCTCIWKKVEHSFAIFLFHAILGLDLQFKPLFFNFFLWYGKHYLKHTL